MRIKSLGANKTAVYLDELIIFISYETPVAYYDIRLDEFFRTNKKYSNTTTRHINAWLTDHCADGSTVIEQHILDDLIKAV